MSVQSNSEFQNDEDLPNGNENIERVKVTDVDKEISSNISKQPVRKLKSLSLSEKMRLLKEVEKGKRKKKDIAKEFGIPASTLSTICKSRDRLQELVEVVDSNRKRMKKAKHPDVEEETMKWLLAAENANIQVSGVLIREKAQWFAQMLGHKEFQASCGWLEKFRSRYLYIMKNLQKKVDCTDENDFHKWNDHVLPTIIKSYQERDIFCANETCLFYKCFLEKNNTDECNFLSEEQIKQWVTLLLCTNMSGSEKLPVLLITKSQNPLCLSHIKSYPVQYEYNKQACMTPDLFGSWLKNLDEKFAKEKRKIALIINENPYHSKVKENMKAIKLFLVQANLIHVTQPMDQGIIKSFKYFYRKNSVLKMISSLNESKKFKTSILDCMQEVHMAWENVSPAIILSSFRKAGFIKNSSTELPDFISLLDSENIEQEWEKLKESAHVPSDMTFESFVNIDEHFVLLTHLSDNEIINDLLNNNQDSGNEEDLKHQYIPSFNETMFASGNIRRFIESRQNVPSTVFQAIAHIDQFLLKEKCSDEMKKISDVS